MLRRKRTGAFNALRERWLAHLEGTLLRPVPVLKAQQMHPGVLNKLRLLASMRFDSRVLLTVVLAANTHLTTNLRHDELLPLGSRIHTRLPME